MGIIPGNLAENEVEPVIKQITDFFVSAKVEIAHNEYLGRKKMAYPIDHLRYGYYFIIEFTMADDNFSDIEKKLKLHENLLRYLIVKSLPKSREEREKEKVKQQKQKEKKEVGDKIEPKERKSKIKEKKDSSKMSLDELDKKLEEILDEKI